MVDPNNVTDYERDQEGLETFLLFCCMVPNKTAQQTAKALDRFLNEGVDPPLRYDSPFEKIRFWVEWNCLRQHLEVARTGQYTRLEKTLRELVGRRLNLRTCSVADLEAIHGIGPKTARYFILHSRKAQRLAVLDTHILKHLRNIGYEVPKQTPSNRKEYARIEKIVLTEAQLSRMTPADWDLMVWRNYTRNGEGTAPMNFVAG